IRVHSLPPVKLACCWVQRSYRALCPDDQLPLTSSGNGDRGTVRQALMRRFPDLLAGVLVQTDHGRRHGTGVAAYGQDQEITFDQRRGVKGELLDLIFSFEILLPKHFASKGIETAKIALVSHGVKLASL